MTVKEGLLLSKMESPGTLGEMEVWSAQGIPTGKSATLRWLAPFLRTGSIPDFVTIAVDEWARNRAASLARCAVRFGALPLAVRSDAKSEDGFMASQAGAHLTLLNVTQSDLGQAVDKVAARLLATGDQVLVQAMAPAVALAGVASTHRIADGAPWYCIEMAPQDTAAVTGGRANGRQLAILRDRAGELEAYAQDKDPVRLILSLLREVERLLDGKPLEIEFALGGVSEQSQQVFLLQARPIAAAARWPAVAGASPSLPPLDFLHCVDPFPEVAGQRTLLSLMSDWNPVELLGNHPRPLALSLFEHLIADGVWWRARSRLGYVKAPADDVGLLRVLRGRPFVDVRRSANSLLPQGLSMEIRGALVDAWLMRLQAEPELHDKVEFQVFRTVRDFVPITQLHGRAADGLATQQRMAWEAALGDLSRSIIDTGARGPLERCVAEIHRLQREPLDGRRWPDLLALARRGTFEFSVLARIAFAADAQLRSAVFRGALCPDRVNALMQAGRSMPVWHAAQTGASDADGSPGHLRAGTFDITQPTWAASDFQVNAQAQHRPMTFSLHASERRALQSLLREAGFSVDAVDWLKFVQRSRQAREWAKFVFSRHLSAALEGIATELQACALDREHASWVSLTQLQKNFELGPAVRRTRLAALASEARQRHEADRQVIVSPVLRGDRDRLMADSLGVVPNFVGRRRANGPLVALADPRPLNDGSLRNMIVVIGQADPGFDWLFECGIAGLITAWGGANSHMAIRCAECGLTAAIGCGEAVYARAAIARHAHIDPVVGAVWLQ